MAAILAAAVIAIFGAGFAWLLFGNRFRFGTVDGGDDGANLAAYAAIVFAIALAAIWLTS